jgi:hypothetical protein
MRRWNLLFVAASLAAALITLSGAGVATAAPPSDNNFKGKAAVYFPNSDQSFVVNFTCLDGIGGTSHIDAARSKWTVTFANGASFTGSLVEGTCISTISSDGSSVSVDITAITLSCVGNCAATLDTLELSNITNTKTFVSDVTTVNPPQDPGGCVGTVNPCITIIATAAGQSFNSTVPLNSNDIPFGTLTIQLPKTLTS